MRKKSAWGTYEILPGQPVDVERVLGEVLERRALIAFLGELEEVLAGQVLVLGDVEMLDLLGRDPVNLAGDQVAQMPDCGLFVAGQVGLALGGQEVVNLETNLERI